MSKIESTESKRSIKKVLDFCYWLIVVATVIYVIRTGNSLYGIIAFAIAMGVMFLLHKILKVPFKEKNQKEKEDIEEFFE